MAEKGRQRRTGESAAEKGTAGGLAGNRKKTYLLAGIWLVLLLAMGGVSWLAVELLYDEAPAGEVAEVAAESGPPARAKAVYLNLDPPFLANYLVNGRQQYVQVAVAVMAREQDVIDGVNAHMPLIRNRLVMLLSGEQFSELQTDQGREQLRARLLAAIREILQQEIGKPGVEQVLFTNFVMQ